MNSMSNQERHDYILRNFILKNKPDETRHYHDIDVIKEHHRFLWEDDETREEDTWEVRLARRYYNKLFKEYCIADLSRYKDNKVALRWRTKDEVVSGKGQFQCGSRKCNDEENLRSWEVNFAYKEQGERKNALVKLRLCSAHSAQLNYTSRKREVKRLKKSTNKHHQNIKLKVQAIKEKYESDTEVPALNSSSNGNCSETPDEKTCENENDIWGRKPEEEADKTSRETDFERYLEDLLL